MAEQRAQEIGQCGEGELRLGLGTAGPDDRDGPASAFGQRFEQCRLADPGLAVHDQGTALAADQRGEQIIERAQLGDPADDHPVPQRRIRPVAIR